MIRYTCDICEDSYTEWTDYEYEEHNWSTGTGWSECDDCYCELPQITIQGFSANEEYTVGDTFRFTGSLSGNGSDIAKIQINVKEPGVASAAHFTKTVNDSNYSLTNVNDFEIGTEGTYYIYIWATDIAGNGLNSSAAVKNQGTFVYSFTAVKECEHEDWDFEYGEKFDKAVQEKILKELV